MSRKANPARSTRGQLPPHLRPSPEKPKTNPAPPIDQQLLLKKEREATRKQLQLNNLKRYPFGRAYHYFCDLDSLPRLPSHPSYALDPKPLFPNTYSRDSTQLGGVSLGQLLNRRLVGLPAGGTATPRGDCKWKNVCHGYLSETEDKKYNSERVIYTLKLIRRRIEAGKPIPVEQMEIVRKDGELMCLLDPAVQKQEQLEAIDAKLLGLSKRKEANRVGWEFEDRMYYAHSLNQRLHDTVNQMRRKFGLEQLTELIFNAEVPYKQGNFSMTVRRVVEYYSSGQSALSSPTLKGLLGQERYMVGQGEWKIRMPIAILNFGKRELMSVVELLIGKRSYSLGQIHFYQAKSMLKKLMNRDLMLTEERKQMSYDQYSRIFRKRYEQMRKRTMTALPMYFPTIDEHLNHHIFRQHKHEKLYSLFKLPYGIRITGKDFIFLMLMFWLSQAINSAEEAIKEISDLPLLIASDFFPKVCNSLVEVLNQPKVGLIFHVFQGLADLMGKPDPLLYLNYQGVELAFDYDEIKNVGMVWRVQCEPQPEMMEISLPSKRVKL